MKTRIVVTIMQLLQMTVDFSLQSKNHISVELLLNVYGSKNTGPGNYRNRVVEFARISQQPVAIHNFWKNRNGTDFFKFSKKSSKSYIVQSKMRFFWEIDRNVCSFLHLLLRRFANPFGSTKNDHQL